jgi:hypothetical protein
MTRKFKDPSKMSFAEALAVLRDPGGDGKTKMSHGFSNEPMICGRCRKPTAKQKPGIVAPPGPRCAC